MSESEHKKRVQVRQSTEVGQSQSDLLPKLAGSQLLEQALSELTTEQKQALSGKAADEALRLQTRQADMALSDAQARRDTLDHINAYSDLDKSGFSGHKIETTIKTASGERKMTSTSGARCFVVTASYGDPSADMVRFYQNYRDEVLRNSQFGRAFIAWYYRRGPGYAAWLDQHPSFKPFARFGLLMCRLPCALHNRARGTSRSCRKRSPR